MQAKGAGGFGSWSLVDGLNKAKFDTPRRLAAPCARSFPANLIKFVLFAISDMTKQRARDADMSVILKYGKNGVENKIQNTSADNRVAKI